MVCNTSANVKSSIDINKKANTQYPSPRKLDYRTGIASLLWGRGISEKQLSSGRGSGVGRNSDVEVPRYQSHMSH